ncbi:subtilisin-like serine protease [Trifolium medium]|uniref:Subtilisin-like serine protease n=1 Tax=Trifolium medium TaxID=97028 RepID=A0A392QRU3_9FABA|nr:subtilisin-like serine protease [Trifolium medium]
MKPDISAPGVNILAAYSPLGKSITDMDDKRMFKYNIETGTSMACPHVAGVVAYVNMLMDLGISIHNKPFILDLFMTSLSKIMCKCFVIMVMMKTKLNKLVEIIPVAMELLKDPR